MIKRYYETVRQDGNSGITEDLDGELCKYIEWRKLDEENQGLRSLLTKETNRANENAHTANVLRIELNKIKGVV